MTQLIAFRVVQAIGAGGIGAGAFALIGALVPPRERGRYQAMSAAVMAIGTVGGTVRRVRHRPPGLALGLLHQTADRPGHPGVARADAARTHATPQGGVRLAGLALFTIAISALVLAVSWAGTTYAWALGRFSPSAPRPSPLSCCSSSWRSGPRNRCRP
ncbi:hypothetical protein ACFV7Q_27785 [Streptomyces sp. NPDC059851]|uniref:hypothetical protein n=1 Tax=Streptomyces sp. NPDC059851 TaxID=3346971 RepID=UPI003659CF51